MAIINTYPTGTPKNDDFLLGTSIPAANSDEKPATKNFKVSDVSELVSKGYKDYVFSFTQSGTNDPVITELNNNTGLTFTFTTEATGIFVLNPSSDFDTDKTWIQVTGGDISQAAVLNVKAFTASQCDIVNLDNTGTAVNGVNVGFVEVRIYS